MTMMNGKTYINGEEVNLDDDFVYGQIANTAKEFMDGTQKVSVIVNRKQCNMLKELVNRMKNKIRSHV